MNIYSKTSGRANHGFTLIEVMIALAVLTIGLTGLAAMQMSSMQYVHSSHYRSMATTIALDFEERLWLELADNTMVGCPDASAAAGSPVALLATHWNRTAVGGDWDWSTAPMLRIPGLTITPGTPGTPEDIGAMVRLIPITLSWKEARFGDKEEAPLDCPDMPDGDTECFIYNVRIQCRSAA
jgi:type IV pilus assembly protein PilV